MNRNGRDGGIGLETGPTPCPVPAIEFMIYPMGRMNILPVVFLILFSCTGKNSGQEFPKGPMEEIFREGADAETPAQGAEGSLDSLAISLEDLNRQLSGGDPEFNGKLVQSMEEMKKIPPQLRTAAEGLKTLEELLDASVAGEP